mmetsp:Transcript_46584/g.151340  ORF Transcript_46584/g.151340 Transcript_46584/m.151340 type:complete len:245 (+) Transcript_46584:544-1278(+)
MSQLFRISFRSLGWLELKICSTSPMTWRMGSEARMGMPRPSAAKSRASESSAGPSRGASPASTDSWISLFSASLVVASSMSFAVSSHSRSIGAARTSSLRPQRSPVPTAAASNSRLIGSRFATSGATSASSTRRHMARASAAYLRSSSTDGWPSAHRPAICLPTSAIASACPVDKVARAGGVCSIARRTRGRASGTSGVCCTAWYATRWPPLQTGPSAAHTFAASSRLILRASSTADEKRASSL